MIEKIPYIVGDGVGQEITESTKAIIDTVINKTYTDRKIEWLEVPGGEKSFKTTGIYMPDETLESFRYYGIGIKGPLTTPIGCGIRSLNVYLRQSLDLYVCLRPVRWFNGVACPVKHPENVNITVFRENTEDIYSGIEWANNTIEAKKFYGFLHTDMHVDTLKFPKSSAFGVKVISKDASERLIRAACNYAIEHGLRKVTLVHKGNIMKYTEGAFKKWGYDLVQKEFEGKIELNDVICDAFLQNALLKPEQYEVVATMNLNGDYISDMLAAQVGGIGIAPGANINYDTGCAIFEATHGTAPDIAGKNIVNPCSHLLSAVMLLEHIGWQDGADVVYKTLEESFKNGYATRDLANMMENGHALSTSDFTKHIIEAL